MSARRPRLAGALAAMLIAVAPVWADDDEVPDADFLEYLGMWEESDEEWLVFAESEQAALDAEERIDPAPDGEESMEKDDES